MAVTSTRADARWTTLPIACLVGVLASVFPATARGQAGLRQSLERLDRNGNGEIEPDEVTPLARPYLERITAARRMSLDRPNEISNLQEAARIYHALQNGAADKSVRPTGESTVKPFGVDPGQPLVPAFGLAEVKFPYTQDDLDFANRTMRSHDHNRDGYIDREEAKHNRWTHRNPFDDDLNHDDRLSRMELTQRYARRRLLEAMSDQLGQRARRTGGEIRRDSGDEPERRDESQWWRNGGNRYWLTASLLGRFDSNKNGRLEANEANATGFPVSQIDINRDTELTREELHAFISRMQDDAGDLGAGLPGWFFELDANRDKQVSLSEFASPQTPDTIRRFDAIDANGDGLLTSNEVTQAKAVYAGSYQNRNAQVLPPGRTIISEIEVDDEFTIGDLNVQLSITHSNTSFLDAYLTGPDGQRVELFTEVGGRDDNFDDTIFDDQSKFPITKARPPFRGTFMPEGLQKRQASLSHFADKSVAGIWQLVIRGTRSDRFGMLHGWSLLVTPRDEILAGGTTSPAADGPERTVAVTSSRPSENRESGGERESNPKPVDRPRIDYAEIARRMQEAVRAGKMNEAQVREAWIKIKSEAKGKDGKSGGTRSASDPAKKEAFSKKDWAKQFKK